MREIAAGDTVGYGATWTAERPSRVATVAAGYADGYLRALSGRAFGVFAGQSVPLIGRVSMDLITFDVTDAPAASRPAPPSRLIGPENTPDDLAARAGTIGYEILTALGEPLPPRVPRRTDGRAPPRSAGGARSRRDRRLPRRRRRRRCSRWRRSVALVRPPFYARLFWRAFVEIAWFSLPVVALTAVFTGMVLALQSYTGFARFNAQSTIASVVVISLTRELGPVLAALMVAGRIGAAFAAEIGTMRVTDQIDALTTLSTDPMKYLVAPRILAATLALPLLVLVADILGVMGGWLIGTVKLGFISAAYLKSTFDFLQTDGRGLRPGEGGRVRLRHRR